MSRALPRVLTLFVAAAMLPVSAVAASQVPLAGASTATRSRRWFRPASPAPAPSTAVPTRPSSRVRGHRVRGGVWTNDAVGADARIGLVSMGGSGFTARFDDVRVHRLLP